MTRTALLTPTSPRGGGGGGGADAMLAEAADHAGSEAVALMERVAAAVPAQDALPAMIRAYLSETHAKAIETGCATAALASEMPRQAPEVRTRRDTPSSREMIDSSLARSFAPEWGQSGAHEQALVAVSTMVGALVLARAVDDPRLSDAMRDAAQRHLTHAGDASGAQGAPRFFIHRI